MPAATLTRSDLARLALDRLAPLEESLRDEFHRSGQVSSFTVDDLFPKDVALRIYESFPEISRMVRKKNLGQDKYVGFQMDQYDPIVEETIYSFQEPEVVDLISRITAIPQLIPDRDLYAGGISVMCAGNFLNPHLDNSHDKDQQNFRALNLLYYCTPGWREECGGNLELWDRGPEHQQRTIASLFNRLVVMVTNKTSWHSVSRVDKDARRCCVSNYYFAPAPVDSDPTYHVTSFRGRPGEKVKDVAMQADNLLRTAVKKTLGEKLFRNPHVYKRDPK